MQKWRNGCSNRGIINLLAGVAYCDEADQYLTHDSRQFHLKMGYTQVARMKEIRKEIQPLVRPSVDAEEIVKNRRQSTYMSDKRVSIIEACKRKSPSILLKFFSMWPPMIS